MTVFQTLINTKFLPTWLVMSMFVLSLSLSISGKYLNFAVKSAGQDLMIQKSSCGAHAYFNNQQDLLLCKFPKPDLKLEGW